MNKLKIFLVMAAIALAIPGISAAASSASVDGQIGVYGGYSYNDPGSSSETNAVSISYNYGDILTYYAYAGGGSITGGLFPNIAMTTYACNAGAWMYDSGANAGTYSAFFVGAKPGFAPLEAGAFVPIRIDYTSVLTATVGTERVGVIRTEPYGVAFNFDDVMWRPFNQAGSVTGSVRYGDQHSVGLYTSIASHAEYVVAPGAWAQADLYAWIRPLVDPAWNAAHNNGYQIYYTVSGQADAGQVPIPPAIFLLAPGLAGLVAMRKRLG